ncbi:MAG: invasin domain 3-containing protein, partial [Candidatus Thorarchaeota archaeon]
GSLIKSPTNNQVPLVHDPLQDNVSLNVSSGSLLIDLCNAGEQSEGTFGPGTYTFADDFSTVMESTVPSTTVRCDEWGQTVVHIGPSITTTPDIDDPSDVPVEEPPVIEVPSDTEDPRDVPVDDPKDPTITTTPTFRITSMVNLTGVDYCRGYRLTVLAKSNRLDPFDPGTTVTTVVPPASDPNTALVVVDDSNSNDLFLNSPSPQRFFPVNIISSLTSFVSGDNADSAFAESLINGGATDGVALIELGFEDDVQQVIDSGGVVIASTACITIIYADDGFADELLPTSVIERSVFAGPAANIIVQSGDGQTGEVKTLLDPIELLVVDAEGNPVSGASVNFFANEGSTSIPAGITEKDGTITVDWTLGATAGSQMLFVEVNGGNNPDVTISATAEPGAPAILTLVAGNDQTGEVSMVLPIPVVICLQDICENVLPGELVTFSPGSGGSASPMMAVTDAAGKAETIWTLGPVVGTQLMTISANPSIIAIATAVPSTSGDPEFITIDGGNGQTADVKQVPSTPLTVLVTDALLDPVVGATVNASIITGAGSISPSAITNGSGIATFNDFTLDAIAGLNEVEMSVSGFPGAGTVVFTATGEPGDPDVVNTFSGTGQSAVVGNAMSSDFGVKVEDACGNVVGAGVVVNWAVTSGVSTLDSATSLTDASGCAFNNITLDNLVSNQPTITASVTGGSISADFNPISLPDSPDLIAIESGDGQSAEINTALASPMEVLVTDQHGNPVGAGESVTWTVLSGGGSLGSPTSLTNASGIASNTLTV